MSAFIHSPAHVIAIVASAARLKLGTLSYRRAVYDLANPADCQRLCDTLYLANVRSVNNRYNARMRRLPLSYLPSNGGPDYLSALILTPAPLCKAIDSLRYQSGQRADWDKSTACAILTQLRERASRAAAGTYKAPKTQPGYDKVSKTEAYELADVWAIN